MGPNISEASKDDSGRYTSSLSVRQGFALSKPIPSMDLDGVPYAFIKSGDVPPAYCEVDVIVNDNGLKLDCVMVSGLLGSLVEGEELDTLRPLPAWFIFEVKGRAA